MRHPAKMGASGSTPRACLGEEGARLRRAPHHERRASHHAPHDALLQTCTRRCEHARDAWDVPVARGLRLRSDAQRPLPEPALAPPIHLTPHAHDGELGHARDKREPSPLHPRPEHAREAGPSGGPAPRAIVGAGHRARRASIASTMRDVSSGLHARPARAPHRPPRRRPATTVRRRSSISSARSRCSGDRRA